MLTDTSALDIEAEELQREIEIVAELIRQCVDENSHIGLDQAEYQNRYDGLAERYDKVKARFEKIEDLQQARRAKREQLDALLGILLQQDSVLTEFDETLWFAVIDKVLVNAADDIQFTFRDGSVVKA